MKTNLQLFKHLLYLIFFRKKAKREKEEAKKKAAEVIEQNFANSAKDLAVEMARMHMAVKKSNPTDYIKKMQPYFVALSEYMKENKCGPIEAAMFFVTPKTKKANIIWWYATAAEILKNTNGTKSS